MPYTILPLLSAAIGDVCDPEPPLCRVYRRLAGEELVAPTRFERPEHGEHMGRSLLAPFAEPAPGLLHSPAIDGEHGDLSAEPVEGFPSGYPNPRGTVRGKVGKLEEVDLGSRELNATKPYQEIPRPSFPLEEGQENRGVKAFHRPRVPPVRNVRRMARLARSPVLPH